LDNRSLAAAVVGVAAAVLLCFTISSQAPVYGAGFSIMLTQDASTVLSDADIVSYSASAHELRLTPECEARLEKGRYLAGPFTVVINGETVLSGTFVPPFVSRSYPSSEVVIMSPSFDLDYGVMKIQLGYPWAEPGAPELDDGKIVAYFASAGRLVP
jgi:hypothetical protein